MSLALPIVRSSERRPHVTSCDPLQLRDIATKDDLRQSEERLRSYVDNKAMQIQLFTATLVLGTFGGLVALILTRT